MNRHSLAPLAHSDIESILIWTYGHMGDAAGFRYEVLLRQAIQDVAEQPDRKGSVVREEFAIGVRTYHLWHSRKRVRGKNMAVRRPRHFLVYRSNERGGIEIGRVLHDSMDLQLHVRDVWPAD